MRGNFVTSLAVVCLLGATVTGCVSTQATDATSSPGDSFALMGSAPAGSQHPMTSAKASSTPSNSADMDEAVALAEGVPYVRSEPHKVPPFPLVLNRTVQHYVDEFAEH